MVKHDLLDLKDIYGAAIFRRDWQSLTRQMAEGRAQLRTISEKQSMKQQDPAKSDEDADATKFFFLLCANKANE